MCTIIVRHQMDDWCSTIVAANRDEFYDRTYSGPAVLFSDPLIVGGRDDREGGTWFGITGSGLYLGLTNQRSFATRDDSLRSRGELVLEALHQSSLEGVRDYLARIDPSLYNEFNLIFGDGEQVWVAYSRRSAARIELESLSPGVHVLCNDRLGSAEFPKAVQVRSRVMSIPSETWPSTKERLVEVLADCTLPDPSEVPPLPAGAPFDEDVARYLQAVCVRTPVYGTVSSTIAAVKPGEVVQYAFASGAPCDHRFEDMLHLMRGKGTP